MIEHLPQLLGGVRPHAGHRERLADARGHLSDVVESDVMSQVRDR